MLVGPQTLTSLGLTPEGHLLFPDWVVIGVSSAMVIGLVVFCCNATNLMDGLDGLCGGVTAIIAAGFLFLAVHLAMYGGGLNSNWDALRVVLGLALLGALLGFIPYNFNPASIFMGDTGSMFLGFACAITLILMAQERPKWFLASMVMFALPVLDTILAFARRYVNGRPVFSPDKFHFHHQLVARGFSVKKTVLISYGLAIAFALLGATIVFMRTRYAVAVYLVVFGSIVVAAYKMGMVHEKPRVVTRNPLDADDMAAASPTIDASTVLEVRERDDGDVVAGRVPGSAWIERERQEVP
jgi:UDP-GlcNAc:undecaprenyl-phosphate GlcNAc-1-phosphate transferase